MPLTIAFPETHLHVFAQATGRATFEIVEGKAPVAYVMQAEAATPDEARMLAYNLKDFANGDPQGYRFGVPGRTLHYHVHVGGVDFYFHHRDADGEQSAGTGRKAASVIVTGDRQGMFEKLFETNPEGKKIFLANGTEIERRSKARMDAQASQPTAPKSTL